ncbi:nuclear transport factor 2 family protein [Amycolatopsis jejuensis]|uniref:nuclear transport factor 2 family protein n=1 Tax=Amycolatopsis jejuensis TaxID=330084 RepID=UPI000524EE1F|nr:nuclear transport factor 2 family protein [Amycolatopsis jejuensis]
MTTPAGSAPAPWWVDLYARIDAFDPALADELLTEDHSFTMGNRPALVGREAFQQAAEHLQGVVASMHHTFVKVIEDGDHSTLEAIVEYRKHDGTVVALPVLTAIERRDGRIAAQRVYVDPAPLFAGDK